MGIEPILIRLTTEGITNLPRPPLKALSLLLALSIGFEPISPCFEDKCSNPLSYESDKIGPPGRIRTYTCRLKRPMRCHYATSGLLKLVLNTGVKPVAPASHAGIFFN